MRAAESLFCRLSIMSNRSTWIFDIEVRSPMLAFKQSVVVRCDTNS